MSRHTFILAGLCILLAGALAINLLAPVAHANTPWNCYRVNELPDMRKASSWKAATRVTDGLNLSAPHAPSGTVVPTQWDSGDAHLLCVKQ